MRELLLILISALYADYALSEAGHTECIYMLFDPQIPSERLIQRIHTAGPWPNWCTKNSPPCLRLPSYQEINMS